MNSIDRIARSSAADPAGTPGKKHSAGASGDSAPEASGDSVRISGSRRRVSKKTGAAPAGETSPAPLQSPPPQTRKDSLLPSTIDVAARKVRLDELNIMKEQLEKGALAGEAFSDAAYKLSEYVQDKSDPLIKRMAQNLLGDYVNFKSPEANWVMKVGSVEGPVKYLRSMKRHVDDTWSGSYLGDSSRFPEFLKALAKGTAGALIPQEALMTVAHLGSSFAMRSTAKLPPEARKNEPEQKDISWGAGCASLIDFWWNNGQIEIHSDGELLKPGSTDIKDLLFRCKVAVRGSAIELKPSLKPHSLKEKGLAKEIMQEINPRAEDDQKDTGITRLQVLYMSDPSLAAKVMDVIIDEAQSHIGENEDGKKSLQWGTDSISRLLFHARENDWLRDLMKEHLPALRDFPCKAYSYGLLSLDCTNGFEYTRFFRNLTRAFPEILDAELLRDGLSPMLRSDDPQTCREGSNLAREIWKERPDLVSPTVEMLLKDNDSPSLQDEQWSLIHDAAEKYDWVPEKSLMDNLISRLYLPPGREKRSLFDGSGLKGYDLGGGIKLLSILQKKNPGFVKGYQLANTKGELVSVNSAIIDRLANDPGRDEVSRYLYTKGGFKYNSSALYSLIQGDEELQQEMLQKVKEGYAKAGSISGMSEAEKGMLTMLYCLEPEKNRAASLREIFLKDMLNHQGFYVFSDMVDRIRREEMDSGIDDLKKGALTAEAHIDRARGAIAIAHYMGTSSDLERHTCRVFEAMEEGRKTGSMDLKTLFPGLLAEFQASLTKNGTVGAMPAKDLALVQIIEYMARSDEDLKNKTWEMLRPHLAIDQGYGNGIAVSCLDPFRKMEIEKQEVMLAGEGALTRSERIDLYEEILAIGKTSYNFKEEEVRAAALSAFCKGLSLAGASSPLGELPLSFTDPADSYKAYCGLMPGAEKNEDCAAEWVKLKDILKIVGGEAHLDLALDTYHYVEEMSALGMDRGMALAHALRSRSLGSNPREIAIQENETSPGDHHVEVEEAFVDIGGIKLDIRKSGS
ncbi:MAG: hypothetical protein AB9903_05530 [Vulcanimicrobiota bacterium]